MSFKSIFIPESEFDTYFVTDIHGMYDLLQAAKKEIGYRSPDLIGNVFDRMISCGDLCDRGDKNYELMQMFRHGSDKESIIGNHEIMGYLGTHCGGSSQNHWYQNGGYWAHNTYETGVLKDVFDWAVSLPYAMSVQFENGPHIGLVHAGVPEGLDWTAVRRCLEKNTSDDYTEWLKQVLVWDRSNFNGSSDHSINGVDLVLHGHNITDHVLERGNRIYFDTGTQRVRRGSKDHLTMLKYEKDRSGTLGDGWLSCHQFSIDEDGELIYIQY